MNSWVKRYGLALGVFLFVELPLNGCKSNSDSLMPMDVKSKWDYTVRNAHQSFTAPLSVVRPASVAETSGFLLSSPFGEDKLAWKDGELLADKLSGTSYSPPIPLILSGPRTEATPSEDKWQGTVQFLEKSSPASATINCKPQSFLLGGLHVETVLSTISIQVEKENKKIDLLTWFQPGVGVVRQEERINGIQTSALELLSQK